MIDLSLRIHAHPELSFQEVRACGWLSDWLAGEGFTVERGLGSLPTAFRGEARAAGGEGRVGFLAEYDAIPEYGHSCGHNVVAAAAVGAAAGVHAVLSEVGGAVVVLGTPAEEGGGGKNILAREGFFTGLDAIMLIYPGMDNIAMSRLLAVTGLRFEFFGKAAHAAARPELGVNALDALLLAFNGINALRQQLRSDARIHGIIRAGGTLPMVIPDYTCAEVRVRANDTAYLEELVPRVIACFQGAAEMTGARLAHEWNRQRIARPLLSNQPLAAAFAANLTSLGRTVRDTDHLGGAWSGDTGNVSYLVPAIQPQVAMTDRVTPPHSHEFTAASAGPAAHDCLIAAAKAMAMTALDVLATPSLREAIGQSFRRTTAHPGGEDPR
ncbi:MAG: M20 family metallopeptidase [Dehalococcoidia bacterium]